MSDSEKTWLWLSGMAFVLFVGFAFWLACVSPGAFSAVKTVKHDGHLFVMGRGEKDVLIHHPDCPCGGEKDNE